MLAKASTPSVAASASEEIEAASLEYSQPEASAESLAALPDFATPAADQPLPARREKREPDKREKRAAKQSSRPRVLPNVPRASTSGGEESQNADPAYLAKHPLNLNSATAEQLELLPGVGPAMAAKIIAARKEKGGFKSVEELDEVPGIGEKKMETLRPLVTVS